MKLYHASNQRVESPRIMNRFATLDFGTGFYTTTNEAQAIDFAVKTYLRRGRVGEPTVNLYEVDADAIRQHLEVLEFPAPDAEWLRFIVRNRREGRDPSCTADVIIGPVANDDVFETVALFESGLVSEEEAIARFKVKDLFDQVLFCNEHALAYLAFVDAQPIEVPA